MTPMAPQAERFLRAPTTATNCHASRSARTDSRNACSPGRRRNAGKRQRKSAWRDTSAASTTTAARNPSALKGHVSTLMAHAPMTVPAVIAARAWSAMLLELKPVSARPPRRYALTYAAPPVKSAVQAAAARPSALIRTVSPVVPNAPMPLPAVIAARAPSAMLVQRTLACPVWIRAERPSTPVLCAAMRMLFAKW